MAQTKLEILQLVVANSIETQKQWVPYLEQWDSQRPSLMVKAATVFWSDHERFALKSFFIDKNINETKQHFYTCGKLDEYRILKHDDKLLDYGLNHLSYALLSDSQDLIKKYTDLKHSNYDAMIKSGSSAPIYAVQCIIKEDWKEYERAMDIIKDKTFKKFPPFRLDASFYEALAEKNSSKTEQILAEFVSPKVHNLRNKNHELINQFISHPALGYAKLAWLKGIEVEVNSPLIPKELLPVNPLEKYENEYNFLLK